MKDILIFSGLILLLTVGSCRQGFQAPHQERSEFALRIGSMLPQGWTVEGSGSEVIITRQDPVTFYPCVALDLNLLRHEDLVKQFVITNGTTSNYRIRLRRETKLDPSEYARLKALNDRIVVTKSTVISGREFYEDQAMRSSDSAYRLLPEYYDDSASIYVETNAHPYECIYPSSVARECETLRQKLDSLFSRYSNDSHRKTLAYGTD